MNEAIKSSRGTSLMDWSEAIVVIALIGLVAVLCYLLLRNM